ncbi:MAG: hypothetical protein M1838_001880 [Thelocarpon superellum]|nr:MAG: hypothetical protein M1838_001880 [Thelocarpon superellum]
MPWRPLPRIAFAVAVYPFQPSFPADLPLELGDELYIIEQGGTDGAWYRGYLVAPPSLLAGLTSVKGQTLEARVFSGIFPRNCVEVREVLADAGFTNGLPPTAADPLHDVSDPSHPDTSAATNGAAVDVPTDEGDKATPPPTNGTLVKRSRSRKEIDRQRDQALKEGLARAASPGQGSNDPLARDPNAPKPPAPVPMLKVGDETPTSAEEPLVDEIASCLREWHSTNLHDLFLSRKYHLLDKIAGVVRQLDFARRQLLHDVLTQHELEALRERVVWDLVNGNKMLGGGVVVRDPAARGRIMTGDDSAIELTRLQAMMSLLDERPVAPAETSTLHHLLMSVKSIDGSLSEPTSLLFYLAAKRPGEPLQPVSEVYAADVPLGATGHSGRLDQLRTLFTDLTAADVGEKPTGTAELYLIVRVQSYQAMPLGGPDAINGNAPSRDGLSVSRSASGTGSFGLGASMKAGRRSLLWGAKNVSGPLSNRSMHSSAPSISSREGESTLANNSEASLTGDAGTGRPASRNSAYSLRNNVRIKRIVGVGVVPMADVMTRDDVSEQVIPIWTAAPDQDETPRPGETRHDVVTEAVQCLSAARPGQATQIERVRIYTTPFISPDADTLVKRTPTLIQDVDQTQKIGFSGAPTKPRSDIYITLNQAFLPRHALLSHPRAGSTPLQQPLDFANLQLTLAVCRPSGEKVEHCIFPAANETGLSTWHSTAVRRDEPWNQVLRLAVPQDLVPECHIHMTLADAPNAPVAVSYVPLWEQHAFLRDGDHSLLLYKLDDATSTPSLTSSERGGYLSLSWSARGKDDVSKDEAVTGPVATLRITTYLCSTIFSQDQALLGLLKWRERAPEDVLDILSRVAFVPEIEIVKLLSDVFDALFAILVEQAGNDDYEDLVFGALVTVLGIVHDRRFNLGPLVDQYTTTRFHYPFAAPCLIRSFARLLSNPTDSESSRKLRATFKVGRHIFKFIIHAREQQKAKEAGIGITSTQPNFTRELQSIFKGLEALMIKVAPILVGSQTLAVQHFHTWLPELVGYVSNEDIAQLAVDFVDCCADVKGKLILYKLVLIMHYARLTCFDDPEARRMLLSNTVHWLAPYWGTTEQVTEQWREQVRLCCSVLSTQINELEPYLPEYIPKIVDSYRRLQLAPRPKKESLSLLFATNYPFLTKPIAGAPVLDEAMIELSAILAALSRLPGGIIVHLPPPALADFLFHALQMHLSILEGDAFPSDWISVHIYHHQSSMKTLEHLARILMDSFLPDPEEAESFNTDLWHAFFTTLLKLVGSDALALETFPEQKRRAVWRIAGDVREQGAELLRRTWSAIGWETSAEDRERWGLERLGGYQVQYVPGLVAPIVELCLSVHGGLRAVAVEVLHTMVMSEWTLNQDLAAVQAEMIECLDRLFKSKHLTESILQKLFINEMIDLLEPLAQVPDDPMYKATRGLIATLDEFLDMLVAVHNTEMSGEVFHIIHTLRLMDFLRDMQKEDISIRYVHQLAQIQARSRNLAEAGLALRMHADAYPWDATRLEPAMVDPSYPAQTAFERREALYFEMIHYFEEGKSWEHALAAYKELAEQYESNTFDFAKLARTQKAAAKVHEAIVRGDRQQPRFFRVVYSGLGFPPSLRDKHFICEGSPSERLATFMDRMMQQHPSAQIVTGGEIDDVEGQFLEITAVTPHRDLFHPVYQRARVLPTTREYLLSSWPRHFAVTTQRHAGHVPVEEQWVEKTLYTTTEAFPTILKRSEIVSTEDVRFSPLQTAIERTHRKTQELVALEKRIVEQSQGKYSSLIEAIALAVDPASDSSVARYRVLLPPEEDPDDAAEVELEEGEGGKVTEADKRTSVSRDPLESALKMAMVDHAMVVKRCLASLTKSHDVQVRSYHEDLTFHLERTYARELAALTPPAPAPMQSPVASPVTISPPALNQARKMSFDTAPRAGLGAHLESTVVTTIEHQRSPGQEKNNRLSLAFLKQSTNDIADMLNGISSTSNSNVNDSEPTSDRAGSGRRSRSKSTKRRSYISEEPATTDRSTVQSRGSAFSSGQQAPSTPSISSLPHPRARRGSNESKDRPQTSSSSVYSISGSVGNVKKRLSLLRIGRKHSKTSVKVDMVVEE